MDIKHLYTFFLICWMSCGMLQAQPIQRMNLKDVREKSQSYYDNNKHFKALPYLLRYEELKPKDLEVKLKIGITYLYTNRPDQAQAYLQYVAQQKDPDPVVFHALGRAHHLQHNFGEAIRQYKQFLANVDDNDDNTKLAIKDEIKRCAKGMELEYSERLALVENLGDKINTSYDDFAPVFSNDFSNKLYFSSMRDGNMGGMKDEYGDPDTLTGNYRADIFVSELIKGTWSATAPLADEYNTKHHDVIYGLSDKGGEIYFGISQYTNFDYGDIYKNNFLNGSPLDNPVPFADVINSEDWDGNAHFFRDSVLIFSSDRAGGYGGKDIYLSIQNEAGEWGEPVNLGPTINTPYDEDCPFLAANGATLYFSSNNLNGMGGMDIYKSTFAKAVDTWTKPINLGVPINSAGDEDYFKMSEDGLRAYFSSSRAMSYGKRDLYVAFFKQAVQEMLESSDVIAFRSYSAGSAFASSNIARKNPSAAKIALPTISRKKDVVVETASATTTTEVEEPDDGIPTYKFQPIFYQDYENLLITGESVKELNRMVKLLNKHKDLKVELTGHSDSYGAFNLSLMNSLKNVESIAEYLTDNGIDPSRIVLKGTGPSYPIAADKNTDDSENEIGRRLNRRVQMEVYYEENVPIRAYTLLPDVSTDISNPKGQAYMNRTKGLTYKVQIKALEQLFDDPVLSRYPDAMIETTPEVNFMRYSVGLFDNHEAALQEKMQLVGEGFKDAFIAVYIDGRRLKKREFEGFVEDYPDLATFVKNDN